MPGCCSTPVMRENELLVVSAVVGFLWVISHCLIRFSWFYHEISVLHVFDLGQVVKRLRNQVIQGFARVKLCFEQFHEFFMFLLAGIAWISHSLFTVNMENTEKSEKNKRSQKVSNSAASGAHNIPRFQCYAMTLTYMQHCKALGTHFLGHEKSGCLADSWQSGFHTNSDTNSWRQFDTRITHENWHL